MSYSTSVGDVPAKAAEAVLAASRSAIAERGTFSVAISGGSLPKLLAAGLTHAQLPLDKWNVFLADERIVPLTDDDSNFRLVKQYFPDMHVVPIDPTLSPPECARDYQRKIVDKLGEAPVFDAVLLGLGPDGHTCSLFPGHELLDETDNIVAPISNSPKPPPKRVTLTLPVLGAARAAMFICTGAGKAGVVKDILQNTDSKLPGALVRTAGPVQWFLDEGAAGEL
ncbi:unnamed protein product [Chondrus crispus]|uniref:6-phosphogluconolactonase n=1 Tax=Chondrus crispus TaxID=2769 RepID=R7QNX3_CHOCR|nr:unnamed protein product [Chondrus crispus]CDF40197.1 unnamed protein product [Chondrus crispus]|eukprot:XP_005710491.1 unnamed protein product [Chondrus crispus]